MSQLNVDEIYNKDATGGATAATGFNISGVCTATSFKGDGSALTGIAATDTIAAASLTVSGITTTTGVIEVNGGIELSLIHI